MLSTLNQQPSMVSSAHPRPSTVRRPPSSVLHPAHSGVAPRLAYILSASHSGSTLLAMLLGAQSGACTVGELKAGSMGDPERYSCSCGLLIKQCGFWSHVSQAMGRRGFANFDITRAHTSIYGIKSPYARRLLAPLHRGPILETFRDVALSATPSWGPHLRETQCRNVALIASIQEVTQARIVLDSSKVALRLKYLLRIPELNIKVVRLMRDGRAVALTYMDDWNFADAADPAFRGGGSGVQRQPPRRDMADAAREWKRSNEAADCLLERLPASQWLPVQYEQLCARPELTLRRLCEFLELDSAAVNLNFRSRKQHVIGNGMRFDTTSEIRLDERWRNQLSAEDLHVFDRVAGGLNRKYGYV